jgi:hypothetical protein
MLTGNVPADLSRIAAFYADKQGLHPKQQAPIRFRDPGQGDSLQGPTTV